MKEFDELTDEELDKAEELLRYPSLCVAWIAATIDTNVYALMRARTHRTYGELDRFREERANRISRASKRC